MTTQCGSIRSYGPGLLGDACVCVEDMGAAEFMRFIENYFEQDEEEGAAEEELSQVDMATDAIAILCNLSEARPPHSMPEHCLPPGTPAPTLSSLQP